MDYRICLGSEHASVHNTMMEQATLIFETKLVFNLVFLLKQYLTILYLSYLQL